MELSQNVPNPFDYNTEIEFKIPKSGLVRLSIVNMLGETVYMYEQDYSPGYYKINWNKQQSSGTIKPGVYLYRLESNGEEIVRKMLIK